MTPLFYTLLISAFLSGGAFAADQTDTANRVGDVAWGEIPTGPSGTPSPPSRMPLPGLPGGPAVPLPKTQPSAPTSPGDPAPQAQAQEVPGQQNTAFD